MDVQPERIGPYVVGRRLGAGGMGTVYYAVHEQTGEAAAVKVLPAALAREPGFVPRFRREIASMQKLANRHIVQLHESGVDGELHYYAMEFVDGETLAGRLTRERRIPWREAVELAVQICSALKAAHDAGVIHRDLKPSNLLIEYDGTIKLTDFGIAHVFAGTQLTADGGVIGTAEFMSPEQARGVRVTRQSDLYALGAVLYTMLTGRPPFTGKTARSVIEQHVNNRFDEPRRFVPDLPHEVNDVVCQLLEKEADKRPPDAYVLSRTLQTILSRIDYSSSLGETAAAAPTRAAENATAVAGEVDDPKGPGEATFVRDYVKSAVEQSQRKSALGRFLDNVWVLVGLLVVVVAVTVWMWRSRSMTPEQHLAAAESILRQPRGANWLEARDDHLLPLLEKDAEAWGDRVQPLLDRIDRYEFEQRFSRGGRLRPGVTPGNDAERFLLRAQRQREVGDLAAAVETLARTKRLLTATGEHPESLKLVEGMLVEVRMEQMGRRDPLLEATLSEVGRLAEADDWDQARTLLDDARTLYEQDAAALARIAEFEAELDQRGELGEASGE